MMNSAVVTVSAIPSAVMIVRLLRNFMIANVVADRDRHNFRLADVAQALHNSQT